MIPSTTAGQSPFLSNPDKMHFIDGKWQPAVSGEIIQTVNHAPWLANPGDQYNEIDDQVDLQLDAGDEDGDDIAFAATGNWAGTALAICFSQL